jgi:hypothetical protein
MSPRNSATRLEPPPPGETHPATSTSQRESRAPERTPEQDCRHRIHAPFGPVPPG